MHGGKDLDRSSIGLCAGLKALYGSAVKIRLLISLATSGKWRGAQANRRKPNPASAILYLRFAKGKRRGFRPAAFV